MVFSSILFTFLFLPVVLILYYMIKNDKWRNFVLLISSIGFYAYGEPTFVFVMIGSILVNYLFARLIDRSDKQATRRFFLICDVISNLLVFFIFKYLNFSLKMMNDIFHVGVKVTDIALPIGISFFTFQAMSYVFDVYRKDVEVQKSPFRLALYVAFFPQLIAGPIVRYKQIEEQIRNKREVSMERFGYGCQRFMIGFCKKIILANNFSNLAKDQFNILDFAGTGHSVIFYWLGAIGYSLQILFDFSGYSDMAIGLGHMFGFSFEENFNYPYIAKSVTDFWRRWHISLSSWFRDYVYIPLGGSRVKVPRHLFNLFVVWILTGIWHGANYTFIVWGMTYYIFLVLEKYIILPEKRTKAVQILWRVVTILLVVFNWVMFNAVGLGQGIHYQMAMLGIYSKNIQMFTPEVIRLFRDYLVYLVLGILAATPVVPAFTKLSEKNKSLKTALDIVMPFCMIFAFLWAVSFLIIGAHNPFIYFNF